MLQAALSYAKMGWHIFPCRPKEKIPLTRHGCRDASADPKTIEAWWKRWPSANIGLLCGPKSGVYVVDVDKDPGKGVDGWKSLKEFDALPATAKQNSPRGGAHYIYKASKAPDNKNNFRNGIDIRCDGYYILLAPSIHPNGKAYAWADGGEPDTIELAEFPDFMRPENEKKAAPWLKVDNGVPKTTAPKAKPKKPAAESGAPVIERARLYLRECEPAIQGHGGHDALLWAARAMAVGFELDDATALQLLEHEFNPRCSPPWDMNNKSEAKDFRRKVKEARRTPGKKQRGWLLEEYGLNIDGNERLLEFGAELASNLIASSAKPAADIPEETPTTKTQSSVEDIPPDLLTPPGFVGDLCKWINGSSRKEQPLLTLGAALAFAGVLCGRKVRDEWDLRTNLYCMGVAPTCAGKEHARSQIKRLIEKAGVRDRLLGGEDVTSDAAIENSLELRPAILFLWDEIGHMMGNIKAATGAPHLKTIVPTLMKLFTSANSTYVGKEYADAEKRRDIVQPHACLYGTTVPGTLYKGISSDELRDGFLGRVLTFITESDPEPDDQRSKTRPVPEHLIQHVQGWVERRISAPEDESDITSATGIWQITVPTQDAAQQRFLQFRKDVAVQKRKAQARQDGTDCLWGRAEEQARKIALTLAANERFDGIEITLTHADYACRLVYWLNAKELEAIEQNVADSMIEDDKKMMLRVITSAGKSGMKKREITRKTQKFGKRQRDEYLFDLCEAGTVNRVWVGKSETYFAHPWGLTEGASNQQDSKEES